jgi:probable addiction module antidote protein
MSLFGWTTPTRKLSDRRSNLVAHAELTRSISRASVSMVRGWSNLWESLMAKSKARSYDAGEYLETDADMAAYLQAALEEGDPALVIHALGNIARARGMSQIARETGLRRESLYKALSPEGNPEFATVLKVVQALGIKLHAEPTHVS